MDSDTGKWVPGSLGVIYKNAPKVIQPARTESSIFNRLI